MQLLLRRSYNLLLDSKLELKLNNNFRENLDNEAIRRSLEVAQKFRF